MNVLLSPCKIICVFEATMNKHIHCTLWLCNKRLGKSCIEMAATWQLWNCENITWQLQYLWPFAKSICAHLRFVFVRIYTSESVVKNNLTLHLILSTFLDPLCLCWNFWNFATLSFSSEKAIYQSQHLWYLRNCISLLLCTVYMAHGMQIMNTMIIIVFMNSSVVIDDNNDNIFRQSHFQRVILMSGSIFSGWARVDNPAEVIFPHYNHQVQAGPGWLGLVGSSRG